MAKSAKELREKAGEARKWVASPSGQRAIREAIRRAVSTASKLKSVSHVEREKLNETITL